MFDLTQQVSQSAFGELVGISQQAVSDLLSRGIIAQGDASACWLLAYCANLREVAAGRQAGEGFDLPTERARLAREQADKIAMQNAQTRRELAPAYLIEEVLAKAGSKVAGILEAIPGQVKRRLPSLPASEIEAIQSEIVKARNIAAAVSLDDLDLNEPSDRDDDAIADALDASNCG